MDMHQSTFRKSSYSANTQQCVEVATTPDASAIRDTKHRDQGLLSFESPEWAHFVAALKTSHL